MADDVREHFVTKTAGARNDGGGRFNPTAVSARTRRLTTRSIFVGTFFGLADAVWKSGAEHLRAFLDTSGCCTVYVTNADARTLEATDGIVSAHRRHNIGIIHGGVPFSDFSKRPEERQSDSILQNTAGNDYGT